RRLVARVASVPTLAMQQGDFSQYPKTIRDPVTGQPFPNNVIPPARIGQFAKGVIKDFYGSVWDSYVGGPDNFVNNVTVDASRDFFDGKKYMLKFDHNLGTKDIFAFTHVYQKADGSQDNGG